MMTDPIADMLTRIRNALLARHARTNVPKSKLKFALAQILKSEGYIADVRASEQNENQLTIVLKYNTDGHGAIDGVKRMSRPGRRMYVPHDNIPKVCSGLGISVLSTSHGLLTDKDARRLKVGGELICEVW